MEFTPLDWLHLHAEEIKAVLSGYGLRNARVVGWAGAGLDFPGPAEIQVDLPEFTDLTSGDLRRLDGRLSERVGISVVVRPLRPGQGSLLPGEKIRYL